MSKRRFQKGRFGSRVKAEKKPEVPKTKAPKVPRPTVISRREEAKKERRPTIKPSRLSPEEASSGRPAYSPGYFREMEKRGLSVYSTPDGTSKGWFSKLTAQSQRAVSQTPTYGEANTPWHLAIPAALSNFAGYGGFRLPAVGTPGGQIYTAAGATEGMRQHEYTHVLGSPLPWKGRDLLNAMTPEQRASAKDWYFRGKKPGLFKGTKYSLQESSEIIPTLLEMADWNPANLPENLKPFFIEMGMFQPSAFQRPEPRYGRTATGAVALPPRID